MSSTEQTGRLEMDLDLTDSQPRIEPSMLVAAPQGGAPTPLPRRRAPQSTGTGMRAIPPPIPPRGSSPPDATAWSLRGIYHAEPAAPDVTVATGLLDAAELEAAPAAASDPERDQARALAAAVEAAAAAAAAHAARVNAASPSDTRSADDADEAARLAAANAAANAALPKLPTVSTTTKPPLPPAYRPWAPATVTRPSVPPIAAAAAALFSATPEAPALTSPLELVDLEPVDAPSVAPVRPLPVVQPAQQVSPLVAEARASAELADDFDVVWDTSSLTRAQPTSLELPVRSKLAQRATIGLFLVVTCATVGYLATRSATPRHAAAPVSTAAQPASPVQAPAPAPAVQAVAAPAAVAAETPKALPGQPQLVKLPVSSTPAGALVTFVDGDKAQIVGRTPTTITIDTSKAHDIALTMVGHETQLEHVPVGGVAALAVTLPAKTGATLPARPHPPAHPTPSSADDRVTTMVPAHTETPVQRHNAAPTAKPHIVTAAPRTAAQPASAAASGVLMISSKPPCEIVVDGKSTHLQTPQKALPLAPGPHTIVLVNAQLKIHKTVTVDIVAKKPTKIIQDFTTH